MTIGFDAKRAFHNGTGLGHYSRTLIHSLSEFFPNNTYVLFNPKPSKTIRFIETNVKEVLPTGFLDKTFSSVWRSSWVKNDLIKNGVELYHGLSHEIPFGLEKTGIKSVVTIHDLIHERFPDQYKALDVRIYRKKFRYACQNADKIIAISNQTKADIVEFYSINPEKISVCYQSCNPAFGQLLNFDQKEHIRKKYNLPQQFLLSVGSLIERKNLLTVCKAYAQLGKRMTLPLVVIGQGGAYKIKVKQFVEACGLQSKIIFLSDKEEAKSSASFQSGEDFPAIYQLATAMVYTSVFEGFGIPVLEALYSGLPVITSNTSCLPEAGGNAALYVDPTNVEQHADGLLKLATEPEMREQMKIEGLKYASGFGTQICAEKVMDVYKSVLK